MDVSNSPISPSFIQAPNLVTNYSFLKDEGVRLCWYCGHQWGIARGRTENHWKECPVIKPESYHKLTQTQREPVWVFLGNGVLNWRRSERVVDRYGYVYLSEGAPAGEADPPRVSFEPIVAWDGSHGKLIAFVTETRQSPHIGDFFRGLFPSTPALGSWIELSATPGTLEITPLYDQETEPRVKYSVIGMQPDDGRDTDWLNPEALYKVHYQTVSLFLRLEEMHPDGNPSAPLEAENDAQ